MKPRCISESIFLTPAQDFSGAFDSFRAYQFTAQAGNVRLAPYDSRADAVG
jgi:hypothetical protein